MPQIGVVADDLTGATTIGDLLARSKAKTVVFLNEQDALKAENTDDLDAVLISSNSRPLPKEEAYAKLVDATKALKKMGVKYFSKRIDTTLRGGIGVEVDAMMDQLDDDVVAVVVPAMPQSRRILVGGYSVIDGVALINTPVAQDVRTPVKENYIPLLLSGQTRRKVGLVELRDVLAGTETIAKALKAKREEGCGVIVVDAITLDDVENIAKAVIDLNWNVVAVDPGPFTSKLAYVRGLTERESANLPNNPPVEGKTVIVAAGSATPVTKRQIDILTDEPGTERISVEPIPLVDGGEAALAEIERVVEKAIQIMEEKTPRAIVFETALHGTLLNLDEEDAKRGYAKGMSADRINSSLGVIVHELMDNYGRTRIAGIYCTGGDTMVNVCNQLGVSALELLDYVIPQTDLARLVGAYDKMPIVGKGGLTGNDHTAIDIVDRLMLEAGRED